MSWQEQYQQGSFRGVPFKTQISETSGGRRGTLHEFPFRDVPYFQDLGRLAKSYIIDCLVIGADYMAQRDALIAALDQEGPGLLVHPYLGQIQVAAPQYNLSESTAEGGMARFSISFVEAGRVQAGESNVDSALASQALADDIGQSAPSDFIDDYAPENLPSYVDDEMAGALGNLGAAASDAAALQSGVGDALDMYQNALADINDAITFVRSPVTLAENIGRLIRGVAGMAVLPIHRVQTLISLFESPNRFEAILGATPIRKRQRDNVTALSNLIEQITAAEAVRAISNISFASFEDAQNLRDTMAERLDDAALLAADRGDDRHSEALDALRRAMVRDIAARSINLARLFYYTPSQTEPALVIANRIYGHDNVKERADEIIARNNIQHPAFISASPIELRTPEEAAS